jgi:hypothetical protein
MTIDGVSIIAGPSGKLKKIVGWVSLRQIPSVAKQAAEK